MEQRNTAMERAAFIGKLINVELLGPEDIDDIARAATEFRRLNNSRVYNEIFARIRKERGFSAEKRAPFYLELCNKWGCRIGGRVREEALKAIPEAERLVGKIDKSLERIERPDYALLIKPVELLMGAKGLGITSTSKILSLAKPELYMMIDQLTCHELGFANNSVGYFHYLLFMRDVARRIRQLAQEVGIEDLEAYLKPSDREWKAPLAIYMDEWNWMNITYKGP